MPLPLLEGVGKRIVLWVSWKEALSRIRYSPRRGRMVKVRADARFVHHLVGIKAGGIDHPAAVEVALVGTDAGDVLTIHQEILEGGVEASP